MNDAQTAPLLVTASELAQRLGDPDWVIVDCRFNLARPESGEAAYRSSHVPGAYYAHLDRDLADAPTPRTGRHPLPQPGALARLFSAWGVAPQARVVAYDDAGGAIAARLWWLLRWMGHGAASLLDGGWQAWQAAGLPTATDVPAARAATFQGDPGHMPVVATADLERRLGDPRLVLLDARARPRYAGIQEPIDPVAGHVPGAINVPFQGCLTVDGRFRPAMDLRPLFDSAMRDAGPGQVVVMCGSGVTACHELFAMELAGLPGAGLYPGSWSEWIRSPQRPVARGEERGGGS